VNHSANGRDASELRSATDDDEPVPPVDVDDDGGTAPADPGIIVGDDERPLLVVLPPEVWRPPDPEPPPSLAARSSMYGLGVPRGSRQIAHLGRGFLHWGQQLSTGLIFDSSWLDRVVSWLLRPSGAEQ
jgi:hypothetical protein